MVQIQFDIPEELDKKIKIYAIKNNFSTKADAILDICKEKLKNDDKRRKKS